MEMHDFQYLDDGLESGQVIWRFRVPGGYVYSFNDRLIFIPYTGSSVD